MSFILRIFISGLIAFVPSEDGKRVTVLLLNTPHGRHAVAGTSMPEHKAVLLARAAACDGSCSTTSADISDFLFPDSSSGAAASASLQRAVQNGAVWPLAGSDLSIGIPAGSMRIGRKASVQGKSSPDTAAERSDFRWVPSLKKIDSTIGALNPAVLSETPPADLIAARLELTSGEISTYSLVKVNGKASPIDFYAAANTKKPHYVRAAANWVQVEIKVTGNSVTIVDKPFGGGAPRKMSLKPLNGVVEMAVLNISRPVPPRAGATPQPGEHFARFWDLLANPPSPAERVIPHPPGTQSRNLKNWDELHPADGKTSSALLRGIFFDARGPYDQVLCPMSQYP
jgi:hypothetical protein